ncbi:MAG: 3-dehydroquinate synthase [Akkermansia sp.]|nr:3-dehydroquinate synthase [Akkermansia sp.]
MPTVNLSLGSRSYCVHVENNSLKNVGYLTGRLRLSGKAAVISDSNVCPLYGDTVIQSLEDAGFSTSLHVFEAGEQSKNLQTVEKIVNEMVAAGHDRSSFVVALGGGVVGDMAGFIASIYYRGIPFIQVPTTVMAQVDSSVGGKTAVDIAAGKNLIGAFHQPRLVVADPTTLLSLPDRVLREGMAEMVKHAAIRAPRMLRTLRHLASEIGIGFSLNTIEQLPGIIAENIAIKARIVEEDEKETCGVRAFLNLGHTLGHGIEASVPYGELLHGEVVSLGLRGALWLSHKYCGLPHAAEREILDTLKALELPLTLPENVTAERALQFTASDKKFSGGSIRFVLLKELGEPLLSGDVTADDLAEAMQLLTTQP